MGQTEHGAADPAGAAGETNAPQDQVAGKIRVTVRRLDRLEATSVIIGRNDGFGITLS
jgi:hypothetical protein